MQATYNIHTNLLAWIARNKMTMIVRGCYTQRLGVNALPEVLSISNQQCRIYSLPRTPSAVTWFYAASAHLFSSIHHQVVEIWLTLPVSFFRDHGRVPMPSGSCSKVRVRLWLQGHGEYVISETIREFAVAPQELTKTELRLMYWFRSRKVWRRR